ncbi:MAG TPA: Hsp20/alpha crystallin family protein [Trueperaceae bacterium]|nr:Hsp20/alpha crystallin family protein [Trueperaceae bacterium]
MALVRNTRTLPVRRFALDPFEEFDRMLDEFGGPFRRTGEMVGYPIDLFETDSDLVLEMAIPGVRSEDLDISIEGRQLSIRGKLPEAAEDGRRYWLQSIPRGDMSRTVKLPAAVEVDKIEAQVADGMLQLTMPKLAEAKVHKIAIH